LIGATPERVRSGNNDLFREKDTSEKKTGFAGVSTSMWALTLWVRGGRRRRG
jgi:hypothetical protein